MGKLKKPTKFLIYDLLRNTPMTFTEIKNATKKANATISIHLKEMKHHGLIESKINPEDARSKIFYVDNPEDVFDRFQEQRIREIFREELKLASIDLIN